MPTDINAADSVWDPFLDDMPGFIMRKKNHIGAVDGIGEGEAGYHSILRGILPDKKPAGALEIVGKMEVAYLEWDENLGPHVWAATKAWLQSKGASVP